MASHIPTIILAENYATARLQSEVGAPWNFGTSAHAARRCAGALGRFFKERGTQFLEFLNLLVIEGTKKKQNMLNFRNNNPATQTEPQNPRYEWKNPALAVRAARDHPRRFLTNAARRCAVILRIRHLLLKYVAGAAAQLAEHLPTSCKNLQTDTIFLLPLISFM